MRHTDNRLNVFGINFIHNFFSSSMMRGKTCDVPHCCKQHSLANWLEYSAYEVRTVLSFETMVMKMRLMSRQCSLQFIWNVIMWQMVMLKGDWVKRIRAVATFNGIIIYVSVYVVEISSCLACYCHCLRKFFFNRTQSMPSRLDWFSTRHLHRWNAYVVAGIQLPDKVSTVSDALSYNAF